ncbi:ATP-dependent protease ATPase subunit HslU [Aminomonas paucivorans]|uniref:ATP-dependent protease ATPase subunit HslU n=1 Tax=Aminomonas paucivorans DSM 12260 TaxID=584708 RepID=E3CVR6_9BACT|nr:ATP-dependent protease ATPase subunit HslU [Aminomonas paucivorans]EFQ23267.1 heat shock protein HslVU, ATPase subunit HslU [Aminomonas paucivorans DSM 12260]
MTGTGDSLTPRTVVAYLDRYIVGQDKAKRAVAVALRNRIRRRRLPEELAREVSPKNILMVGPTGVGKTEIARRLARLVEAPFVKVEATKFTEVGYVGRDVESMIRDLVEASVQMVRRRLIEEVQEPAARAAEERILDALLPRPKTEAAVPDFLRLFGAGRETPPPAASPAPPEPEVREGTREKLRELLRAGKLDGRSVEVEVPEGSRVGMTLMGAGGLEEMGLNLGELLGGLMPKRTKRKTVTVEEARRLLQAEEAEKLVDQEAVVREAVAKAEQEGILFVDEIDKIAGGGSGHGGPDVSREGVQRDLLPIVEGCVVQTKYGPVQTDHMLFIAAGAFHKTKPSDLVPELQGRLPIRVELQPLREEDLVRILGEPESSLVRQYEALLGTEGVRLRFEESGLRALAALAARMNRDLEDIGARRLHTLLEQLLEEISFQAPETEEQDVTVDAPYVEGRLGPLSEDREARKYLL